MIRSAGSKLVVDSWVVLLGVNSVVLPAVVVGMLQIKKKDNKYYYSLPSITILQIC